MHTKQQQQGILHGECIIKHIDAIPEGAVQEKINPTDGYVIVAPSEVSGNHHVIDTPDDDVKFYKVGDRRYFHNSKPTTIRCLAADRHDTLKIKPGFHEIGMQQEYDYVTEALRSVRD